MTPDDFARHLCSLAADEATSERVRLHVFDTLVALRIGFLLGDAGPLLSGDDLYACIAWQVALARSTELDDIEILGLVTPGAVIVPTALLMAEVLGCDEATTIAAIATGYEAMIAIARAIDGPAALARGVWPTYVAATIGAAVTVARLRGFDTLRMSATLALAAARTAPLAGRVAGSASPRFMLLGLAAAEGVRAAEAAKEGFEGDPGLLGALLSLVTPGAMLTIADRPLIEAAEIKPYPTARQGLAAIEAFRALGITREQAPQIVEISAAVPSSTLAMLKAPADGRIGTLVNLGQQLARSLLPQGLHDSRRQSPLPPDLAVLAAKVQCMTAVDIDQTFPERWLARVQVAFADGTVLQSASPAIAQPDWAALTTKATAIFQASGFEPAGLDALARQWQFFGKR